jgi:hypothetical protein
VAGCRVGPGWRGSLVPGVGEGRSAAPSLHCSGACGIVGNGEENKVTKTIFTGNREFIMLADSGEIISQNPEAQSMSGAELNTYRVCPSPPIECSHSCRKHYRAS